MEITHVSKHLILKVIQGQISIVLMSIGKYIPSANVRRDKCPCLKGKMSKGLNCYWDRCRKDSLILGQMSIS